jgi:mRNA interferase HigB
MNILILEWEQICHPQCSGLGMHIITRKRLNVFVEAHVKSFTAVDEWYRKAKKARWHTFADVRATFGSADQVGKYIVFNLGGNKFRLITIIRYQRQKVFIRACLTHRAYDENKWKN